MYIYSPLSLFLPSIRPPLFLPSFPSFLLSFLPSRTLHYRNHCLSKRYSPLVQQEGRKEGRAYVKEGKKEGRACMKEGRKVGRKVVEEGRKEGERGGREE